MRCGRWPRRPMPSRSGLRIRGRRLRATYTFAPRLTLQGYAHVFLATEHYDDFTTAPVPADPIGNVVRLADLVAAGRPSESPG
jgi:hypothetical protein